MNRKVWFQKYGISNPVNFRIKRVKGERKWKKWTLKRKMGGKCEIKKDMQLFCRLSALCAEAKVQGLQVWSPSPCQINISEQFGALQSGLAQLINCTAFVVSSTYMHSQHFWKWIGTGWERSIHLMLRTEIFASSLSCVILIQDGSGCLRSRWLFVVRFISAFAVQCCSKCDFVDRFPRLLLLHLHKHIRAINCYSKHIHHLQAIGYCWLLRRNIADLLL